ncbi:MAG: membrane protein insertase YidC [Bacteroidia bacterium]|nr:MAG: membrane protein insertase YidC [Bacteroidia bacterium]
MDRNSIIGLILIGALLMTWSYFFAPNPQNNTVTPTDSLIIQQKKTYIDTLKKQLPENTKSSEEDSLYSAQMGIFGKFIKGEPQIITVNTDLYQIQFSNKGGIPIQILSKKYKTYEGKPLPLLDNHPANQFGYQFLHNQKVINTQELFFETSIDSLNVLGTDKKEIAFTAKIDSTQSLVLKYTIYGDKYHIDHELITTGLGKDIKNNYFELVWKNYLPRTEKSKEKMLPETSIYYLYNDEIDYLDGTSQEPQNFKEQGKFKWISYKSQFFSMALIAQKEEFEFLNVQSSVLPDSHHTKVLASSLQIPYRHAPRESFSMRIFAGPNDIPLLKSYDLSLERQISLGWALFRGVTYWLIIPAFNFFENFTSNYGIVILLLAIFIKLLISPLTYKSYLSMAKMKIVNSLPEMKAIEEKYKDDATKLQQAKMEFYSKVGVSPFSGCLPMLLQIPILLSMFYFFPSAIQLRQQAFLWADDLSTYDSILDLGFSIPFYGDHVSLFTLLMTLSTIAYTYMQQQAQGDTGPKELKYMGYIFPIIFLGILNNYSAGLSWYYFVMNMLTMGQTYAMKFFVSEEKIKAAIEEAKKKPVKKTRFQKMLEEAQKQQNANYQRNKK